MDGLFTFLILIGIVNSVIKWLKKQQTQGNQGPAPDKPWQRMLGDLAKTLEESVSGEQPEKTTPTPVYKTLKAPVSPKSENRGEEETHSESTASQVSSYIGGSEGAEGSYSLQSEGNSKAQDPQPMWRGSLPGTEGTVAFTASLADSRLDTDPIQEVAPVLNLAFNRDTLLQAVVMHEILTRPQERRRRWKHP